jgi:hypothetical protein
VQHLHFRLALALTAVAALVAALEVSPPGRRLRLGRAVAVLIAAVAAANLLFVAFLWFRHLGAPFALELMESSILQHVLRALGHQPIYTAAQPGFVPFAYNPLYYYAVLPLVRVFGPGLFPLRLLAVLGALGATLVVHVAVAAKTGSRWWGLVAAGLFAAAYHAMDSYLDMAHSDSLMLFAALLGTWLIDRNRSRLGDWAGLLLLLAAFWLKQHGAFFALGGALYLTRRDGWRRAWGFWAVLLLLGPALYVFAGPSLFGPGFHFYTWEMPRHWSRLDAGMLLRLVSHFGRWYPLLLVAAAWRLLSRGAAGAGARPGALLFQLPFAALTAFQGALDPGSSDNVFIGLGTWLVLAGTLGLHAFARRSGPAGAPRLARLALLGSFALLAYSPKSVLPPPGASAKYAELQGLLRALPGTTCAPDIGYLPAVPGLVPAAHWIALDDLARGRARDSSTVEAVLAPALHPPGKAWLLTYRRLSSYSCLRSLGRCYVLEADYGDRFLAVAPILRRFHQGWPRYLYRHDPAAAAAAQ